MIFKLKSKWQDKLATPKLKGRVQRRREQTVQEPPQETYAFTGTERASAAGPKQVRERELVDEAGDPGKDKRTQAAELGS